MDYLREMWNHSRGLRLATYAAAAGLVLTLATAQSPPPSVLERVETAEPSVWQKVRSRLPWGGNSLPERVHQTAEKGVDSLEKVVDIGVGMVDRLSKRREERKQ